MLDKKGEITDLYHASNLVDVGFEVQFNGIYKVTYHCCRDSTFSYVYRILDILKDLGKNATDADFLSALDVENYDNRFSFLAKVQSQLGEVPVISLVSDIELLFDGTDISVTTHNMSIVLRHEYYDDVEITDLNAIDFFVLFLPGILFEKSSDISGYNKVADDGFIVSQYTLDLR